MKIKHNMLESSITIGSWTSIFIFLPATKSGIKVSKQCSNKSGMEIWRGRNIRIVTWLICVNYNRYSSSYFFKYYSYLVNSILILLIARRGFKLLLDIPIIRFYHYLSLYFHILFASRAMGYFFILFLKHKSLLHCLKNNNLWKQAELKLYDALGLYRYLHSFTSAWKLG